MEVAIPFFFFSVANCTPLSLENLKIMLELIFFTLYSCLDQISPEIKGTTTYK
jgi:hypothetical protein